MALQVLQEVLVLQGVLVPQVELENMWLKVRTVETAPLHLLVQTITMWLQDIAMPQLLERITITITQRYILTDMGTRLPLMGTIKVITMKAVTGIMVVIITIPTMMDLTAVYITGTVTTGMHGVLITTA